jgi:sugar lactone lactonase YvrE
MNLFSYKPSLRYITLTASTATMILLSGCGGMTGTAAPSPLTVMIKGTAHGGQQPVTGAQVYLFAANTTSNSYGSASTSLITAGDGTDTYGNSYVLTDASGDFSYKGTFGCNEGTDEVYLLAVGGNPGNPPTDPPNDAIALAAVVGTCSSINGSTYTTINEATTIAMAYALNAFMVDGTHVGAPPSNVIGLQRAFLADTNLVDNATGLARTTTLTGHGVSPQTTVYTLANVLASCVNSLGGNSAGCTQLFSQTNVPSGGNTLQAALKIAAFPGAQTANLFSDIQASAPFEPQLNSAPNDFSLALTFQATPNHTLNGPAAIVIDGSGNLWTADCQTCLNPTTGVDSLVEFDSGGNYLAAYTGTTPGDLHNIQGIAIDATSANVWTTNQAVGGSTTATASQVTKMSIAGVTQGVFSDASFDYVTGIAVDASNNIWISNTGQSPTGISNGEPTGNYSVDELDPNSGTIINGSPFTVGNTGVAAATGVGVDNSGNIWIAGTGTNNIEEFDTNGNLLNVYATTSLNEPIGITINGANEIWTLDNGSGQISQIEGFNGQDASTSPHIPGIYQAYMIAVDGKNQVLIPNCRVACPTSGSTSPDNVLRLAQSGDSNTGGTGANAGVSPAGLNGATGAAIDASGNVWVTNTAGGTLTEIIGFAAPTRSPLSTAAQAARIGVRP